ncbi:MAG: hypothetical protein ACI915_001219 [Gammaproteobacteria bacterium]|jgi:hypothetical protein
MQFVPECSLPAEVQTISELTAAMHAAADNKDWQEVYRIDVARTQLLRTVPAELFTSNNAEVREVLTDAVASIQTIERLAIPERDTAARKLKEIRQRQLAAKAYATASQPS